MRPGGQRQSGCALPPRATHVGAGARERGARHPAAGGRRRGAPLLRLLGGLRSLRLHLGLRLLRRLLLLPLVLGRMGRVRRVAARVIRGRGPRGRAVRGRGPRGGGGLQCTKDAARGLRGPCATAPTALLSGPRPGFGGACGRAGGGGEASGAQRQRPLASGRQPAAAGARGPSRRRCSSLPPPYIFASHCRLPRADPLERRTTRSTPRSSCAILFFFPAARMHFRSRRFFDRIRSLFNNQFHIKNPNGRSLNRSNAHQTIFHIKKIIKFYKNLHKFYSNLYVYLNLKLNPFAI